MSLAVGVDAPMIVRGSLASAGGTFHGFQKPIDDGLGRNPFRFGPIADENPMPEGGMNQRAEVLN